MREALTGRELSREEVWREAGVVAARLAGRGIGTGDVVALDLNRSADLIVAALGVVRAGAAYLPVDGQAPTDRVATIVQDARVAAIIVGRGEGYRDRPLGADAGVPVLTIGDGDDPYGALDAPDVTVADDAPLCVGYTSGSTGVPKGVVVPHGAVHDLVADTAQPGAITSGDRVGQLANPAFDAFTWEIWGALTTGAPLIVLPTVVETDLERWAGLLVSERISTALLTTSLFHMVAREAPAALGSLRQLLVGGEQMDLAATERVLAAGGPELLLNIYGPTETTVFVTTFTCTPRTLAGRTRIPIGQPVRSVALHVLDEGMRPVAPGETGELCVGGPSVTSGYLHNPERTGRSYVTYTAHDGATETIYRTGDRVRQLPDGQYEVVGRADRQVKLRGFRIELEEIEQAAVATGRIEAAFVEKHGEGHTARLVGAFLRPAVSGEAAAGELAAALAERLPAYMLPALWVPLAELPMGSTGKADRTRIKSVLAEAAEAGVTTPAAAEEPAATNPAGTVLAEVWAELLGLPGPSAVQATDDFIGLGGNSILATQAAFRIGERLGIRLDPTDVLLTPSFAELADQLGRASKV
ncbi:non-ribosomal peptide synthetase [Streptomyces sp. NPDC054855]